MVAAQWWNRLPCSKKSKDIALWNIKSYELKIASGYLKS